MALARIFVGVVYLVLGASFLASSGLLVQEFQGADWRSMIVAHSHLFIFFPVFGILALAAFYVPSVVFTDLYWRHLPHGKLRFLIGLIGLAVISYGVVRFLDKPPRAVWELSPRALADDKGEPPDCARREGARAASARPSSPRSLGCAQKVRVGSDYPSLRATALPILFWSFRTRWRNCAIASLPGTMLNAAACCEAQKRFGDEVVRLQADPAKRSLVAVYDAVFLPLKVFFVLVVIGIGLLLALWRDKIDLLYREYIPSVERGVIIGAFAMLFWPAMDYGYQQTSNVLFGRWTGGPQLRLSLVIAPWALLLLFYFLRRLGKQGETVGQIAGVVTAGVAVLRYEDLNDWAVRLLGVGSQAWIMEGLLVVCAGRVRCASVAVAVASSRSSRRVPRGS